MNPNLDGTGEEYETGMGPFGIVICARQKGDALGSISEIRFAVLIIISMIDTFFIAENMKLFQYECSESKRELVLVKEITEVPQGNDIVFGCSSFGFFEDIPDEQIRQKCSELECAPFDNGLVSNLAYFLNYGGALIYAEYPGTDLQSARLLLEELEALIYILSCGFAETRTAGGTSLIGVFPRNRSERASAFFYSRNLKRQLDDLVYLWPPGTG